MTALVRPRRERLPAPVPLDVRAPEATLTFVAWLRGRHEETVDVIWRAVVDDRLDTTLLHHLPPPLPLDGDPREGDAVRRWRAAHRPAMCYYRRGPGFVQVKDIRQAETAARFMLDDPTLLAAFDRCLRPTRLADLGHAERDVVGALVAERLMLQLDGWVTVLPSRMRRWPVPSHLA